MKSLPYSDATIQQWVQQTHALSKELKISLASLEELLDLRFRGQGSCIEVFVVVPQVT